MCDYDSYQTPEVVSGDGGWSDHDKTVMAACEQAIGVSAYEGRRNGGLRAYVSMCMWRGMATVVGVACSSCV